MNTQNNLPAIQNLEDVLIVKAILRERLQFQKNDIEKELQELPNQTFTFAVDQLTNANTYTFIGNKLFKGFQQMMLSKSLLSGINSNIFSILKTLFLHSIDFFYKPKK
jgi:hypothetical protein